MSRNCSGEFMVPYFSLYLLNEGLSRHETFHLFWVLFSVQHVKRPALKDKRVGVYERLFGPEKFSGLSGNRPLVLNRVKSQACNVFVFLKDPFVWFASWHGRVSLLNETILRFYFRCHVIPAEINFSFCNFHTLWKVISIQICVIK